MSDSTPNRGPLGFAEARELLLTVAGQHRLPVESVPLQAACGRILASDTVAPRDVPGFVNSAMDGYAVRARDLPDSGEKRFRLLGSVLAGAGAGAAPEVTGNGCVRITTGAPLPPGTDTVVIKENTRSDKDHVFVRAGTAAGANVRAADEDYAAGQPALARGTMLTAAHVAVLAELGFAHADVVRQARATVLATGDELGAPGEALLPGRIFDSNSFAIDALLRTYGATCLQRRHVRDDPDAIEVAVAGAAESSDVIISCGGVSVGEADWLPQTLGRLGRIIFHKVRMKPGLPFLFGTAGKTLFFGLPGNPVSAFVTFVTLVVPALRAMSGVERPVAGLRGRLRQPIHKRHARTEFQRAGIRCDDEGTLWVVPHARQGSAVLRSVAESDVLIVLPDSVDQFAAGDTVELVPLPGWPG